MYIYIYIYVYIYIYISTYIAFNLKPSPRRSRSRRGAMLYGRRRGREASQRECALSRSNPPHSK